MHTFKRYLKLFGQPVFVVSYVALMVVSYFFWDRPLALYMHHLPLGKLFDYLEIVTKLGSGILYIVLFGILFIVFQFIYRRPLWARNALFLLLAVGLAGLLCDIIKIIVSRARPDQFFAHQLYGFYFFKTHAIFWSFPSGHTTVITAVMVALSCLKPKYWGFFLMIALMISATRIILSHHYLSDVMAGFWLANGCVGYLYYQLGLDKRSLRPPKQVT